MILKIDFESEVPLYIQLKNQIIEGIAAGLLTAGESLPSVRQLASDLGINMHTVNKAYFILKKDDIVKIHKRKGVIVSNYLKMKGEDFLKDIFPKIKPIIAEARCKGISEHEFLDKCKKIYSSFNSGGFYDN